MNSVVVPCYNEEDGLNELVRRVSKVMEELGDPYEIVLVDDGSRDRTWDLISHHASINPSVVGFKLSRNHGHQLAISAGLANTKGDRVFVIDADLQDPPELFSKMIELYDQGADVVYGQRRRRLRTPMWKKVSYVIYYRLLRLLAGCEIPVDTGDFRLVSRRVVDLIVSMPEQQRFLRGMFSWVGFTQVPLLYERDGRFAGEPKYTLRKLIHLAWTGIMSFSVAPLRLASVCGMVLALLSVISAIYFIILKFVYKQPQGWTSLMVVILFVGALQLMVMGIIGEYLGRVFLESKNRPLYILEKRTPQHAASTPGTAAEGGTSS